jgi:putative glutamine amidotransferase
LNYYFEAVKRAGGVPEHVSLGLSDEELREQAAGLDAFVLPGSPADVDPARYAEPRHPKTKTLDADRDRTDSTILEHALSQHKPVLAICYGCQILNVHQGGTLVQDIPAEKPGTDAHGKTDLAASAATKDLEHSATLADGSQLQKLACATNVRINSSHHQSIDRPGEKLRVTARSADGIIEGVELQSPDWVVGVQWHPERMPEDPFAQKLFADFVRAARKARMETAANR